jgi:hypothetical protein
MRKGITSHDGTKKLMVDDAGYRSERVYIKSTQTNEVIKKSEEFAGYHYGLGFSSDDKKVLYLTQPNHWYCGNAIIVWDYERGDIWFLWSAHHRTSSITADSYSDDLSIVVLRDGYGEVSLFVHMKNIRFGTRI